MQMLIQKLLFPEKEICSEWEMYVRGMEEQDVDAGNTVVSIKKGQTVSLETYFNAFSTCKWVKYTSIKTLSLKIRMKGEAKIQAYHAVGKVHHVRDPRDNTKERYEYDAAFRETADAEIRRTEDGYTINFHTLYREGIVYIDIQAEEDLILEEGGYYTEAEMVNPVDLALGICTFKREEFLKRNVNLLLEKAIGNEESPLCGHLEVYISDNGQTVPKDLFASDKIHLFYNRNVGGAGGFTRDMIEALYHRNPSPFTHMILMDDDIILDCNVLERTYAFLQLLRKEFSGAMLGGELFELDKRYLQFEAGAAFRGTVIQSFNQDWDMRKGDAVSANEIENPVNFCGWWYCCIPAAFVRENNLPIPVFIHRDDVEYGVRNEKAGTILLNGICVWHPQGPNKAPVSMNYYDVRNDLIAMCASPDRATRGQVMNHITRGVLGNMLRYRYQVIDCMFKGLEDFYRGPEFLMRLDPVENHKKLAVYNYQFEKATGIKDEEVKHELAEEMKGHVFLWAALCWLLPSKNEVRISGYKDIGCAFRARRIYFLDEERGEGILVEKSYKEAFRIFFKYLRVMFLIFTKHEKMMGKWKNKKQQYTNLEFWEKYLDIS